MKLADLFTTARDAISVKRVFGDPIEKHGVTVIPVASVAGGGGMGSGHDERGQEGEGGGFGLSTRPVGVYVLKDGNVKWIPTIDVNRLVTTLGAIAIAALITTARRATARAKAELRVHDRPQQSAVPRHQVRTGKGPCPSWS